MTFTLLQLIILGILSFVLLGIILLAESKFPKEVKRLPKIVSSKRELGLEMISIVSIISIFVGSIYLLFKFVF